MLQQTYINSIPDYDDSIDYMEMCNTINACFANGQIDQAKELLRAHGGFIGIELKVYHQQRLRANS